ncbi:glutathione S-transferase N-terminal domain-containing protein [Paraburkholderia acidicola]|uniref:Glutathione S-transferase N-terminal domain-containing protein n=1 Tax=Paraburkholderia acidicola TaxID=1912599 RepID=A0ABV1LR23_9BURK
MNYTLYYSPGSCSMAVHIALEELGVAYDLETVPIAQGATQQEPYLSINPKGRVPALRVPGETRVLTELPAILMYLARQHPAGGLLPVNNAAAEARCYEWLAWLVGWIHGIGYGELWRPARFTPNEATHDEIRANGRQVVLGAYTKIEQALADGREWAVPGSYTIVDPFLLVLYGWGSKIGIDMRANYSAWTGHTQRLLERPAIQRVLQREGISIGS